MNEKILINACSLLVCCFMLSSCGNENGDGYEDLKPDVYNVCGKVEKGPFVSGTTITMQPLDGDMSTLGTMFSTTIYDHAGNFSFGAKQLVSQFADLSANGYFFNEVKGELSSGTLNLRAIVDLSDVTSINVNILTHIKYQRVLNLILQKGYSFSDANNQAQKELFAAFGLEEYSKKNDATNISIADGTDAAAALIAISSLILADREEAELTEYIHRLCMEFSVNGNFSESTIATISKDKGMLASNITEIEENVRERYEELGVAVEVKPLIGFIDWNDDGVAGNEILKEGERVRLSSDSIEAPAEGCEYEITISSPIPVFLERQLNDGNLNVEPDNTVTEESFWNGLYEEGYEGGNTRGHITLDKELNGDKLKIKVAATEATTTYATNIDLYDYIGNVVASIHVSQKGTENTEGTITTNTNIMPGESGKAAINAIMVYMAEAFSDYNAIEQLYHFNPEIPNIVSQYIYPSSSNINDCWSNFYTAINRNLSIKSADASALGVWQERLNVLLAINYYNMVIAWGGVPFVWKHNQYDNGTTQLPRTEPEEIFAYLKDWLNKSMEVLEEKHLNTLSGNSMDYFFMSKDVVRILLADILMYEGNYEDADILLQQVIDAGHYTLDNSNYSEPDCINRINEARGGEEIIFAFQCEHGTRGSITVQSAPIIPLMTYTDVMLSHAECLYHTENAEEADRIINEISNTKEISVETSGLEGIKDVRRQLLLFGTSNFAFMKRNGFAEQAYGISAYQSLWPIPSNEMNYNMSMTQNPGY